MTEKRFIIMDNLPKGTHSSIWDKQKQHNQGIGDELWLGEVVAMLNEGVILAEENEQLKTQLQNTCDQRDEFHRGARENANRVGQLEKENKKLEKQLQTEHTMLDNAIHLERTRMGKNSLIQYKEAIQ